MEEKNEKDLCAQFAGLEMKNIIGAPLKAAALAAEALAKSKAEYLEREANANAEKKDESER